MKTIESEDFKQFHEYVFGDIRYFLPNGLPEELFTSLVGPEKITAEKSVLKALRKWIVDERSIRAAGYLHLEAAIPLLENKLKSRISSNRQNIRSAIVWSLIKIKPKKESLSKLIDAIYGRQDVKDLTRLDAIHLLSDYGNEQEAVKTLFLTYMENNFIVETYSRVALRQMFRKDPYILNLLSTRDDASIANRRTTVENIKKYLNMPNN